jgi:hypothetical protein
MPAKNKFSLPLILISSVTAVAFFTFINSLDKGESWRIIFSSIGFGGLLLFTILVLIHFNKARRQKQ